MLRIRHAGAGAALLVVWSTAGCGNRFPQDPNGSGGSPGCQLGICLEAGTDASPAPDAAVDTGTSTEDAHVDAAAPENAGDGSTSDANPLDASNPKGLGSCFAPCELEAIKDCLPAKVPSCVHIHGSSQPLGSDTYCSSTFSATFSSQPHKGTMTVSNNGKVCYSRTIEFSTNGPFFASVYDGNGKLIATESQGMPGTARTVYCGEGTDGPVYTGLQPGGCDDPQHLECESVVEGASCPSNP
jgi:hypothetical protein